MSKRPTRPQGLYDPAFEHDSCGVGFVAHIRGTASRSIVEDAYVMLKSMEHRAGVGAQPNSGDGAGILTAIPHEFLARVVRDELRLTLPAAGRFGTGLVFLPRNTDERNHCKRAVETLIEAHGQKLLGWRIVPVASENADLGDAARLSEPHMEQLLVAASDGLNRDAFERKLVPDSKTGQPSTADRRESGAGQNVLRLLTLDPSHDLQGHAPHFAINGLFPGSARARLR